MFKYSFHAYPDIQKFLKKKLLIDKGKLLQKPMDTEMR